VTISGQPRQPRPGTACQVQLVVRLLVARPGRPSLPSPVAPSASSKASKSGLSTSACVVSMVSPASAATVYAQCGGKQGLLRLLMDSWTKSQVVAESYQESLAAADAVLTMQTLSAAYLQITKLWGDVIRVVIDVAPHDDESAAVLVIAQSGTTTISRRSAAISGTSAPCATTSTHGWQPGPSRTTTASTACSEPATCSAGRWSVRTSGCWPKLPPRSCGHRQASEPGLIGNEPCCQPDLDSDGRRKDLATLVTLAAFRPPSSARAGQALTSAPGGPCPRPWARLAPMVAAMPAHGEGQQPGRSGRSRRG
jgi:hypothetical protein